MAGEGDLLLPFPVVRMLGGGVSFGASRKLTAFGSDSMMVRLVSWVSVGIREDPIASSRSTAMVFTCRQ